MQTRPLVLLFSAVVDQKWKFFRGKCALG